MRFNKRGRGVPIRFTLVALLTLVSACVATAADAESFRIAILRDGPSADGEMILSLFTREIEELTRNEFDVAIVREPRFVGDWRYETTERIVDEALGDPDIDLVLAMGVLVSHEISTRGALPKPAIAPFILDTRLQNLPESDGPGSGIDNLNYLTFPSTIEEDIRLFREMYPFDRLTFLGTGPLFDALPEIPNYFNARIRSMGIDLTFIAAGTNADDAIAAIPANTEAVYLAPLIHLSSEDFGRIVDTINARGLPSFILFGAPQVERGILATQKPNVFSALSRRVALNVQSILLGEDPARFTTSFRAGQQLMINMATARRIDAWPGWGYLTDAVLVADEVTAVDRVLDLHTVVEQAWERNLELETARRERNRGAAETSIATANLLPQIDARATGLQIDEDRAEASFGSQAERTGSASISGTQLLFSDEAWANRSIQKSRQRGREANLQTTRLDVARDAAIAYLDVLRAKRLEEISKTNLGRSRSNLELAQLRRRIGYSSPGEVYRWENEIASNRKDAIEANARRNVAEIALNQMLNEPLESPFGTDDPGDDDPLSLVPELRGLIVYLENKSTFARLRRFLAKEALAASPELRELDASIEAQTRARTAARRSFWMPRVGLSGEVAHEFYTDGAGADALSIPGLSLPQADETDWNIGISASLPLFEGSRRSHEVREANHALARLEKLRESTASRVEQRVLSALHLAGASYAGIEQSRQAREAAEKNLALVLDAYSQGVVSVIDVLDAQNTALIAEEIAANAVYDFLIDLIEVQRAAGCFFLTKDAAEERAFFERLSREFPDDNESSRS